MARTANTRGARHKRHALNAGEYMVAYAALISAAAVTYLSASGADVGAMLHTLAQPLVKLVG